MTIALRTGQRGSDKNTIGLMIPDKNFWPFGESLGHLYVFMCMYACYDLNK